MDEPDPDEQTLSNDELRFLGEMDERTKRIDEKVDRLVDTANANQQRIEENSRKIKRNTTVLGGYSAAVAGLMVWGADKIARFL
jgi:hypothetical protein